MRRWSRARTRFVFASGGATATLGARLKLALSILCENPHRRTGLSTLFHEFVGHALRVRPDVSWVVFAGRDQPWSIEDERVTVVRTFPSNEHRVMRLVADHVRVAPAAKRIGVDALLTVGFAPLRTAGLPVIMHVFSVHHQQPGGGAGAAYRRWAVNRGLRCASLVIANSDWTAGRLSDARPELRSKLLVSHEGLQHERFRPEGPRGGAGAPGNYLLWSGNFYRYKRAELALATYAALPRDIRARFPLVLVGGDWHGGRARAESAARTLGVAHDVRFLGWVSDDALPALYRGARAHLLSTAEETFGRSVVEAMACGCPCVLQDLPVLREVTAGAASFVDYRDTASAAEAVRRVCTDDSLALRLRREGLRRAPDFSFEKLARERLDAIERVLRSDATGRGGAVRQAQADTGPASR